MTDTFTRLKSALSDRYTIESELGQGGMATVYLAHDIKHDRKVADKVLKSDLSSELGADRFVWGGQGESRQIVDSPASGVANWLRNSTSVSILSKTVRSVNCATVLAAGFEPTRALSHGLLIATFTRNAPSFLRGLGRFFAVRFLQFGVESKRPVFLLIVFDRP